MYYSKNLEIHVVDHCNLDCVGCSHESPWMARRFEDPQLLGCALSKLWACYQAPLVKLLGGEPLLHPAINDVISITKVITGSRLRLVTNGTLLMRRYQRLRGIDEIHISSYSNAPIPGDEDIRALAAELDAPITIQEFGHFRWHRSPPRNDPALTGRIFATCQLYHFWQCHTLRDGWLYPCPPAATWRSTRAEGVNLLEPDSNLNEQIENLLSRQASLATCNECLGSVGQRFEHRLGSRTSHGGLPQPTIDTDFLRSLEFDGDAHNDCFQYDRTILPSGHVQIHRSDL